MIKFLVFTGLLSVVAGKAVFSDAKPSNQLFVDLVSPYNSAWCSTCELVINAIKGPLEELTEITKEDVEAAVETACDEVAGPLGPVCASLIDKQIDQLYATIEEDEGNIDAEKCCAAMTIC